MSMLPSDPLEQFKMIIFTVVAVVIISIIGYLAYTKSLLETKVADQATEISQYQIANLDCKAAVETRNAALDKIKIEAQQRADEAAKAVQDAQKQAQEWSDRANAIMASKPVGDDCAATKRLTDTYFGGKP